MRSPSMRRRQPCGRGWCRWAGTEAAGTPHAGSIGSCSRPTKRPPTESTPNGRTWPSATASSTEPPKPSATSSFARSIPNVISSSSPDPTSRPTSATVSTPRSTGRGPSPFTELEPRPHRFHFRHPCAPRSDAGSAVAYWAALIPADHVMAQQMLRGVEGASPNTAARRSIGSTAFAPRPAASSGDRPSRSRRRPRRGPPHDTRRRTARPARLSSRGWRAPSRRA